MENYGGRGPNLFLSCCATSRRKWQRRTFHAGRSCRCLAPQHDDREGEVQPPFLIMDPQPQSVPAQVPREGPADFLWAAGDRKRRPQQLVQSHR